jgi:hypothetical protein
MYSRLSHRAITSVPRLRNAPFGKIHGKEAYSVASRLTGQGSRLRRVICTALRITSAGRFSAFASLGAASMLWPVADVHVFVPEPVQSGGSDNDRRDYDPTGPTRINEVKIGRSGAAQDDQSESQNEVYCAMERSHAAQ